MVYLHMSVQSFDLHVSRFSSSDCQYTFICISFNDLLRVCLAIQGFYFSYLYIYFECNWQFGRLGIFSCTCLIARWKRKSMKKHFGMWAKRKLKENLLLYIKNWLIKNKISIHTKFRLSFNTKIKPDGYLHFLYQWKQKYSVSVKSLKTLSLTNLKIRKQQHWYQTDTEWISINTPIKRYAYIFKTTKRCGSDMYK